MSFLSQPTISVYVFSSGFSFLCVLVISPLWNLNSVFVCFSEEFLSWLVVCVLDSTRGGGQNFGIFSKNAFFIGLTFVMHYGKQDFGFETYLFIAHNWWLLDGKLLFFDRKWGWGV